MSALLSALLSALCSAGLVAGLVAVRLAVGFTVAILVAGSVAVAETGEDSSPEFLLDLRKGQGTAASSEFTLDLRGVSGPTEPGSSWAQSAVFTVNLLGVDGGLAVSGRVYDAATGLGLPGALVELGALSASTDGQGNYGFGSVPMGEHSLRASAAGYASFNGTVVVPGGTTVRRDISLSPVAPGLRVTEVTCKYPGFLYFLDGPAFNVTFTATVDWAGHPPGWVEFLTPKGTWPAATGGATASQTLNMGADFGANGKLRVVAVSGDGARSAEIVASLVVMPAPIPGITGAFLDISDEPDGFAYKPTDFGGVNMSFFDEVIDAGVLPESIPLFGEKPVALSFVPEMTFTIDSKGVADFGFKWDDAEFGKLIDKEWGREHNLRKMIDMLTDRTQKGLIDKRRLPKAAVASMELNFFPIAGGQFQFNRESEQWEVKGFTAGLAGEFNLEKSWPFVFFAGPVPVPMYAKAGLDISAEAELQITSLNPISPNGVLTLEPYVRGSLGVGIDQVFAVEGWIGGGMEIELQYPAEPNFDVSLYLNGGVTVYALLWQWENELLRWDWPEKRSPKMAWVPAGGSAEPRACPRGYLAQPDYAVFHGNRSKKGLALPLKGLELTPMAGPLQTTIFPHSEPDCSSTGTNFHLAWLYDAPGRGTNNRTMTVFSRYDGTDWTEPVPVADDGTADFHPQVLTFADGWAAAAWENERVVLPDSATFDGMKTNLEVAAAWWNPQTTNWLPAVNLSTNGFLDRSPKLAGISRSNVLLVWTANETSHITGGAAEPNSLLFSKWNGSAWSEAQVFLTVTNPLVKYDLVYDGTNGSLVMSLDTSITQTNVAARELFRVAYQGGVWGALERLTDDQAPDDNPQMALDQNGNCVLVWLKENDLSSAVNFAMADRQTVRTNIYCSNLGDAKLTQTSDGRLALLWAEPSSFSSDVLGVFYDPIFRLWGKPKQLTTDEETERSLTTAFWGTGRLVAVYNRCMIGPTNTTGNTDLYVLEYGLGDDLCLKWLRSEPLNPAPGELATLTARVINQGDRAVADVPVAFYLGEPGAGGVEVGRMTMAGPLAPGDEADVIYGWTLPQTNQPMTVYAVADPDQTLSDILRSNNVLGLDISQADLAVQSVTWSLMASNKLSITARIGNVGGVSNQTTVVEFKLGSPTGTNLFSAVVTNLAPGQAVDIGFLWDVTGLADGLDLYVVVDGVAALPEFDRENNTWRLTVQQSSVRPDLWLGPVVQLPGGEFQIQVNTEPGGYVYLETSDDLLNWQAWTNFISTNAATITIDSAATSAPQRFYRAWRE